MNLMLVHKENVVIGQRYFTIFMVSTPLIPTINLNFTLIFISSVEVGRNSVLHMTIPVCVYKVRSIWSSSVGGSHHVLAYRNHTCEMVMVNVVY